MDMIMHDVGWTEDGPTIEIAEDLVIQYLEAAHTKDSILLGKRSNLA